MLMTIRPGLAFARYCTEQWSYSHNIQAIAGAFLESYIMASSLPSFEV